MGDVPLGPGFPNPFGFDLDELMRMLSGARTENARRLALDLVNAARAERKRPAA